MDELARLLYRSASLRRIEAAHAALPLMQRAGAAAARWAAELALPGLPILVLVGPGNNGGDALEVARLLRQRHFTVHTILAADPVGFPTDAAAAWGRFQAEGGQPTSPLPKAARWGLIVDGLFGIGLARPPQGLAEHLITTANTLRQRDACPLLALDCPSGLNADTGATLGCAIAASHTLTFIAAKPGLFTGQGPDHCGEIRVANLDLDPVATCPAEGRRVDRQDFQVVLRPRAANSHKGSFGSAGILGGAHSMVGAAFLAARAALKLGAGRVYAGLLDPHAPSFDPVQPELMIRKPEGVLDAGLTALACGPGLGNSLQANELLDRALASPLPLVLDADALNLLSQEDYLRQQLVSRAAPTLLTPHPAEAARLLDCETAEIQADRVNAALALATRHACHVALKGCGTVIAHPDGQWRLNETGNPGLASAGTGDVLTGIVVAFLAQGWAAAPALEAAVHLHGAAADALVAEGIGPYGLTASEVIDSARRLLNRWIYAA